MNNQQRKYLVDKITAATEVQIKMLRESKPERPNLSNYLLHAVMSGTVQLRDNAHLLAVIKNKALKSTRDNWLNDRWSSTKEEITLDVADVFVIPEDYRTICAEFEAKVRKIDEEIYALHQKKDGLVTRITLASDKTLQNLINEVDDMGNLSLVDTTLKALNR
jgi:hypothetical protein